MSKFETGIVISLTVALSLAALSCGDDSGKEASETAPFVTSGSVVGPAPGAPYPDTLHCVAVAPETWQTTPRELNAPAIAGALGVTEAQVTAGKLGGAHCEESILASQVGSKADIQGIGNACLVVGIDDENPPVANQTYSDVIAICPA